MSQIKMPKVDWVSKVCQVCGFEFDHPKGKRPKTCNDGMCIYNYEYKIDVENWHINKGKK